MKEFTQKKIDLDSVERKVELSILYDFYGELLTEHQKQIFEDYVLNDLSLSEIADEQGISRQGVHDLVKRCSKQLMDYEAKLALIEKFEHTKHKMNRINELAKQLKDKNQSSEICEIEELSGSILEEL